MADKYHTAEYFRQRRAAARDCRQFTASGGHPDFASQPEFVARGQEIVAMMRLPNLEWPADLYQDLTMAGSATISRPKLVANERICPCGCGMLHNMAVSALEGEAGSRRVVWLRTMSCKARYLGHSS